MTKYRRILRMLTTAAAAFALTVPMITSATTIGLSGSLDRVNAFGPTTIAVGDSVTGSFDVALQADNSFSIGDLNFFNLAVGSNQFNLSSGDFENFSGALSGDGSTVIALDLFTSSFPASTAGNPFNLQFNLDNPQFLITNTFSFGTGNVAATVAAGNVVPVPEPRESAMFGFGLALIGFGVIKRRRRLG